MQDSILITGEAADMITLPDATKLLQNAAHTSSIAVYMQIKSASSPLFEYRFLPFMSRVSHILLSRQATNQCTEQKDLRDFAESPEYQTNLKRLDSMIGGWGMVRCEVTSNGNCFLSAIATFLLNNKDSLISKKTKKKQIFFPGIAYQKH